MLPYKQTFEAIGTDWRIETSIPLDRTAIARIEDHIESFDRTYSRFRSDSIVSRMTRGAGTYHFPPDSAALMTFYRQLYDTTDGQVTPLIGSMLAAAGYDAEYSLRSKEQTRLPTWDDAMTWTKNTVITTQPITLDLGAAGKGRLIDQLCDILRTFSLSDFVVDASGDSRHFGTTENIIGLEHPIDPTVVIGAVSVQNASLCASASNRRAWGDGLHHIFNPVTRKPTSDIIATWVIADSAMLADGLATALFFCSPDRLRESFAFTYVRMRHDGTIDYSPDFSGELFI